VLPIEEIAKIIEETENLFGVEHLVLDNASLKQPLMEVYSLWNFHKKYWKVRAC